MPSRCGACGDMDYSDMGDMPCSCRFPVPEPQPAPTIEDVCASGDHAYYGDDDAAPPNGVGRCYCGGRSYPAGGPT